MLSATQVANFLACPHLTILDRDLASGEIKRQFYPDPGLDLLIKLGLEHEQAYRRSLSEDHGLKVVDIPSEIGRAEAVALTSNAVHRGVDAVYQSVLQYGEWYGRADFLRRIERPSDLGAWSYEVVEAKLARSTKVRAVIQLCHYSDLLSKIQGVVPESMHVVLGGGTPPQKLLVKRYLAYFRKVKREYETAFREGALTYPEPNDHCHVCDWSTHCDAQWRADDSLTLVAGISRNQRKALGERSVATMAGLAKISLPLTPRIERIGQQVLLKIREQARVQIEGRELKRPVHELLEPIEPERGLAKLPPPSPADLFLDFESAPYALEQGLEYLIGVVTVPEEAEATPPYQAIWALDRASEKKAFEEFMSWTMARWRASPDMHIYHYAPYEQTAIKRLAGRHSCYVDEVDLLLRGGIFVDLYQVVRQGLRASVESYSIKKMERFYEYTRDQPLRDATLALQSLEAFLSLGETDADIDGIRKTVEQYNRDDCISALRLREWLETLRAEVEAKAGTSVPRPAPKESNPSENLAAKLSQTNLIAAQLLVDVPDDESARNEEGQGRWLLAKLLDWHRREAKSAWWEYHRLRDLSDSELQEDKNALGGLEYVGVIDKVKKSLVHRYSFPPQNHAIDRANSVHDPQTRKGVGQVVTIDDQNRLIDISRITTSTAPHPKALIPCDVVDADELADSILRLATFVVGNGISVPGPFQASRDLLLRRAPRTHNESLDPVPGEDTSDRAIRVVLALQDSTLPIQGPPGSGKTYAGARMILKLVENGKRVGITAISHKVISNLLKELCDAATEIGFPLRAIQKANENDGCQHEMVKPAKNNHAIIEALSRGDAQVIAGTAWLWAREEMTNSVDALFVDEAGQVSLAYALAASPAANSLVLLGDPQQLDQPVKGVHPSGTEVSVLAHLLNGKTTIGTEQGLFLDQTWRLHPNVCDFTSEVFYEGRLTSREENRNQRINAAGPLNGTGLRLVPITHFGNQNESSEEVTRIVELICGLLDGGATWTNKKGNTKPLELKDILIVAPYNAQVSALRKALPKNARVGTVDKFQGQQAPIVLYSMATSTPEDAPRGMEFLYSSNRLNVATSRAQCVTVLVASPALFQVQCKTLRQIELVNSFCRYLELAQSI